MEQNLSSQCQAPNKGKGMDWIAKTPVAKLFVKDTLFKQEQNQTMSHGPI